MSNISYTQAFLLQEDNLKRLEKGKIEEVDQLIKHDKLKESDNRHDHSLSMFFLLYSQLNIISIPVSQEEKNGIANQSSY